MVLKESWKRVDRRTWTAKSAIALLVLMLMSRVALASSAENSLAGVLDESAQHGCLACGTDTTEGDLELSVRGRSVFLHEGHCHEVWLENPRALFAQLQPRGALFTESDEFVFAGRSPWFWVGIYAAFGMVCSAAAAYLAVNRGQAPAVWFFAGLFGNLAALLVLYFIIPKRTGDTFEDSIPAGFVKVATTRAPRACDSCGAAMHPSAKTCAGCGSSTQPLIESEVQLARRS